MRWGKCAYACELYNRLARAKLAILQTQSSLQHGSRFDNIDFSPQTRIVEQPAARLYLRSHEQCQCLLHSEATTNTLDTV